MESHDLFLKLGGLNWILQLLLFPYFSHTLLYDTARVVGGTLAVSQVLCYSF